MIKVVSGNTGEEILMLDKLSNSTFPADILVEKSMVYTSFTGGKVE